MERKFVEKEGFYSYSEARACTWFYTGIVVMKSQSSMMLEEGSRTLMIKIKLKPL